MIDVRREYDEDCVDDFDAILALLREHLKLIVDATEAYGIKTADLPDVELARILRSDSEIPDYVRAFVFQFRRDPAWAENEKTQKPLFRYIRPTGDVLPGYTQSSALLKHKGKDKDDE